MAGNNNDIEKKLWDAADQLRANSKLKSSEYSVPVLGLIFLRYADHKFSHADQEIKQKHKASGSRREISKTDYQARGILYLPDNTRFSYLLNLPEGENIGKAINEAARVLKPDGVFSFIYSHSSFNGWEALIRAYRPTNLFITSVQPLSIKRRQRPRNHCQVYCFRFGLSAGSGSRWRSEY